MSNGAAPAGVRAVWHRVTLIARSIRWPRLCCCCLGTPDADLALPAPEEEDEGDQEAPCCQACLSHGEAMIAAAQAAERLNAFRPTEAPRRSYGWLILGGAAAAITLLATLSIIPTLGSLSTLPEGLMWLMITGLISLAASASCLWMYRQGRIREMYADEERQEKDDQRLEALQREAEQAEAAVHLSPSCSAEWPTGRYLGRQGGVAHIFEFVNPDFAQALRDANRGGIT
jgi:hypothetical protein